MARQEVYNEVKQMFGIVPTFFKSIPDASLEMEWQLMKQLQFVEGPIPNKYRELIGVAISATTKCRYCILFHTEAAKLHGATDAEITDAVQFAQSSAGWSAWLNGMQFDFEQFKAEMKQVVEYISKQSMAKAS